MSTPKSSLDNPFPWKEFIPKSWLCLRQKYSWLFFKDDLIAGITVGIVSVPVAMAFAIASGFTPVSGLYTAIITGFLVALLGGSHYQIAGPTGAFVVIIFDIIQRTGYDGLVAATLIAGLILIIAGICRLGSLIKFIPYPLVTGFTSGLAFMILISQIKDFFGLQVTQMPVDFIGKVITLWHAFPTWDPLSLIIALSTLILIICIRKFIPLLPWGIASITIVTLVTWGFRLPVATIASRFGEIPSSFPQFGFPEFSISLTQWYLIIPDAITIAFLAGIESLLSALVADGMTGKKHQSNIELMAQGIANICSVSFGGIPGTGAIARTAINVKTGAKTPLSGIIHSITILVILLTLSPLVSQISLPALSAVLIMVAWNMSEIEHFKHLFKAPLADIVILLVAFLLTIFIDLTVAVEIGMIFASFLFMKKMSELSKIAPTSFLKNESSEEEKPDPDAIDQKKVPQGVEVYEIEGPFFFGLAGSLQLVLTNLKSPPKVFILRMRKVPVVDASAMHALTEFYFKCRKNNITLLLTGTKKSVFQTLKKFGIVQMIGADHIFAHIDTGLEYAQQIINKS